MKDNLKQVLKLKRMYLLLLLPISIIIMIIATNNTYIAEYVFSRVLFRFLSFVISIFTRFIPFSVMEIGIVLSPILIFIILKKFISNIKNNKDRRKIIFLKTFINILISISILTFIYVTLCGVNYHRYPFYKYYGIENKEYDIDDLYEVAIYLSKEASIARDKTVAVDENNVMKLSESSYKTAKRARDYFKEFSKKYPSLAGTNSVPKKIMFSEQLTSTRIVGLYSMFTQEANYNDFVLDFNKPATMCHELAHLHGYMKEDEANFIAYLVCINSDDPEFMYSGYISALDYILDEIYTNDAKMYTEILDKMDDQIVLDLYYEFTFWEDLEKTTNIDKVSNVANNINDSFIKANGVESGTNSYNEMISLVVADYKANIK